MSSTETAAERRKRRILERGNERMSRVMGTYGKESDVDSGTAAGGADMHATANAPAQEPVSNATGVQAAEQAESDTTEAPVSEYASNLPRRAAKASTSATRPATDDTTEDDAAGGRVKTGADLQELTRSAPAKVSLPAAISAAAFQTQALRMAMAIAAAVLAVMGQLSFAGVSPLVQLLASNAVITLSAAWMLTQQPERFQRIDYQMRIRGGGLVDKALGFAQTLLGRTLVVQMKAALALAWGAYVDSGCYLAIVIALYLLQRGEEPDRAGSTANDMAEKLQEVQQAIADASMQGASEPVAAGT